MFHQKIRKILWDMLRISLALVLLLSLPCPYVNAAPKQKKKTAKTSPTPQKKVTKKTLPQKTFPPKARLKSQASYDPPYQEENKQPLLEPVDIVIEKRGRIKIDRVPKFTAVYKNKVTGITKKRDFIFYTVEPILQHFSDQLLKTIRAPHVAVVAMEPKTGRILAMSEKSAYISNLSLHSGFPAASLFKVITAAAALEKAKIRPSDSVNFRGGTYSLNKTNYLPHAKKDTCSMSVAEALAKSCNPVFGRIGLLLSPQLLRYYAKAFAFNSTIDFDITLRPSTAYIPESDYDLSRTAAGFGEVTITPVHAVALMSAIANKGIIPKPALIDSVLSSTGEVLYSAIPGSIGRAVEPATADTLLEMMKSTTTIGTSKRAFMVNNRPIMPNTPVAAKTGTLRGHNPEGLNNWFIGATTRGSGIAVAVIVVDPGTASAKASQIGRQLIQKYVLG